MSEWLPPEIVAELRRRLATVKSRPSPCEHVEGLHWSKYAGTFHIALKDDRTFLPISFCPWCGKSLLESNDGRATE